MGRLPQVWIAPPPTRELRELVPHRAKLVGLRSHRKAEMHAMLAKCGVQVLMSDLFGLAGTELLAQQTRVHETGAGPPLRETPTSAVTPRTKR